MNLQIRNTLYIFVAIGVSSVLLSAFHLYLSGELHGWHDMPDFLNHASFAAFMEALGWLFLRSPLSGKLTQILQQTQKPSGATETTKVTITEPEKKD